VTREPRNGSTVESVAPWWGRDPDRDTTVNTDRSCFRSTLNGHADGDAECRRGHGDYNLSPLPAPDSTVTCRVTFRDSDNVEIASDWSFILTYRPWIRLTGSPAGEGPWVHGAHGAAAVGRTDAGGH